MRLPRLLLLTDRSQLRLGRGLLRTITECVEAGATHVLLRELDLAQERRAALATAIAEAGAVVIAAHTPLPACAGVHLPAAPSSHALSDRLATRCNGAEVELTARDKLVGRSCHTPEEVRRAAAAGATYCTLSPFAATPSKPGYGPFVDPEHLGGHEVPVYALGGVTPDNAAAAVDAGAYGVAVMGAVMRSEEPAVAVARLIEALS